jgi:hypothetical protein
MLPDTSIVALQVGQILSALLCVALIGGVVGRGAHIVPRTAPAALWPLRGAHVLAIARAVLALLLIVIRGIVVTIETCEVGRRRLAIPMSCAISEMVRH